MPLSEKLLGKDIHQLQTVDLVDFFSSEREETSILEFKSGESSVEDICSEIAAFANTEGGILIVGAPRENKRGKGKHEVRFCQGELTSCVLPGKDWLLQKIAALIVPFPSGIKIQELKLEIGSCFIIEVR
jgi:predicted HTH transcriptional regulator